MKLVIEMALDNAAFCPPDEDDADEQLFYRADGIRDAFGLSDDGIRDDSIFYTIENGQEKGTFTDYNGNTVGAWSIQE